MSNINLTVQFTPIPGTIYNTCQYARIDNTSNPVYVNAPNVVTSPTVIATNVPDGQYEILLTPVYPDGRVCQPTSFVTPPCAPLISLNAVINGGILEITYLAPAGTPQVQINVGYPNGGSYSQMYVNSGNPIAIALPANLYGNFSVTGQSVCDPVSMFLSTLSQTVTVSVNQPVPNYYAVGNILTSICSVTPVTYYTSGGFTAGTTLFTDATLTTPVTGYSYVMINGIVYGLNPTTGLILAANGTICNAVITGQVNYSTGSPNGGGFISAPAGYLVHASISANGPSGSSNVYTLQINIPILSISQTVTNGTTTFTFVMPGSGTVMFNATYTASANTGSGTLSAY